MQVLDPPVRREETLPVALLLGFAGGYLDTYTWITHGVLANAQTANLVFLWVNATAGRWQQAFHFVPSLFAFAVGVVIASWLRRTVGDRAGRLSLVVEVAVLILVGVLHNRAPDVAGTLGISMVAAMQTSIFTRVEGSAYSSVMITGNFRQAKTAVNELAEMWGRIARTNTSTDLLTLATGMILGFLIGQIEFPAFGAKIGLGNAGGLLLSGVIISSIVSRLRFFGNTPNAARNVLEDLGLVVFVAIVGINAGAGLLAQLTGAVALKIFIVGFIACTIPPFIVWAIGFHFFKINPAVLMGGVAGARSHSGPCREAAVEIQSSVPWIGFPVAYAVSGILLTVFGYFAMILAQ